MTPVEATKHLQRIKHLPAGPILLTDGLNMDAADPGPGTIMGE